MSSENPNQIISSRGRVIKKPGMNDKKASALDKLRALKDGSLKRTDQYEVRSLSPFSSLFLRKFDFNSFFDEGRGRTPYF